MKDKRLSAITLAVLFLLLPVQAFAEKGSMNAFIGIQPGMTIEPFYDDGEFDLFIFPIVLEMPVNSRMSARILPTVNYHFGGKENGISDVGFFSVLPVFFKKRQEGELRFNGFYLGPVFGFGRNILADHYTTTFAAEPGYMFASKKRFTITLGAQLGASYFGHDSKQNEWILHWGPKASFGFWLR